MSPRRRARRSEDAEAWIGHFEAIQHIAAQLTRLATAEDVGLAICTETRQVIDYHNCRVYLLARDGVDLQPISFTGDLDLDEGDTWSALRLRVGQGLTGWVAEHGQSLLIPDATADERGRAIPGSRPIEESMLLVPLRYEARVTGVIVLSKLGRDQFQPRDLRLLEILAAQAAVAFANAELLAGRDLLVTELDALVRISRLGNEATSESELARALAPILASAGGFDTCVLSRWDEGSDVIRTLARESSRHVAPTYDVRRYPATRAVLNGGPPIVVQADDPGADPAERALMRRDDSETLLLLPLRAARHVVGLVELSTVARRRELLGHELDFCLSMADQAGAVLETARLVEQLRRAADIDQVTGVGSHRLLQERLSQEVARADRIGAPLSVLMVDLDGFKAVNDTCGHAERDRVLRDLASSLKFAVRTNDIVARYGGDEFCVLMPDTTAERALIVARRLVAAVQRRQHQV